MHFGRVALACVLLAACGETPVPAGGPTAPGTVEVRGADRDLSGQAAWTVDFGTVEPGATANRRLVLANPGAELVTVRVEGIAPPFAGAAAELRLPPREERTLGLQFAPTAHGSTSTTAVLRWGARSVSVRLVGRTPRAPCTVAIDPPQLDFGTVRVGGSVSALVDVQFTAGFGCGEIEGFSLESDGTVEVEPRHTHNGLTRAEVSWSPQDEGPTAGTLEIKTLDAVHSVPISGRATLHCAELSTERIEFGTLIAGCGYAEQPIEIRNTCSHPLEPVPTPWWRSDPPAGFAVDRDPASPASLPPGGTARFIASYQPDDPGYHEGRLRFWEGTDGGAELELVGEAEWPTRTETFEQPGPPEVLLVVDGSMFVEPFESRLDTYVSDLIARLGPYRASLGVTSTTLEGTEACPGEDGRLVPVDGSRARIVDLSSPDALAQVRAHLADLAACADASEGALLEAAIRALTPPLIDSADDPRHPEPDDGNLGLVEDGRLVWRIYFTARDSEPLLSDLDRWATSPIRGGVAVVVWPARKQCEGASPSPYLDGSISGAEMASVCDERWPIPISATQGFGDWGLAPTVPARRFDLDRIPRDVDFDERITEAAGEIAVRIDGVPVPSDDPAIPWDYDVWNGALEFAASPPGPSTIEIVYNTYACP